MIARVFPRQTKMTPIDDDAYVGLPPLNCPQYNEIHISVCFTWDIPKTEFLAKQWRPYGDVKIGGPAISGSNGEFVPGQYLKSEVTITSRGCPNQCPWCFVPKWEGKIKELPIKAGRLVQDNNLLACSSQHIRKVFDMLHSQKQIEFSGGFEAHRLKDWIIEELRGLNIKHIWLAYDSDNCRQAIQRAIEKLKNYFPRDKIRCYILIGYPETDTIEAAESRLKYIWDLGALPFAMRYRTPKSTWNDTYLFSDRKWNLLTRQWSRPAIIKSIMSK